MVEWWRVSYVCSLNKRMHDTERSMVDYFRFISYIASMCKYYLRKTFR